jgi:hypothetical protein
VRRLVRGIHELRSERRQEAGDAGLLPGVLLDLDPRRRLPERCCQTENPNR